MSKSSLAGLWLRWVAANGLGELVGLGLTLLVGLAIFMASGEPQGIVAVLLAFAVAVASGAIEATVVGLAQWWAMRGRFPLLGRGDWWRGTLIGALAAYVLGYLPSTIMSLSDVSMTPTGNPTPEPPQWQVLLLAAGLGLVAGAVLSFGQYPALRKVAKRAGLWIPANMLAWMLGMPLIFWGIDKAQALATRSIEYQTTTPVLQAALWLAGTLLACGMLVGAVHGAFLARIAQE